MCVAVCINHTHTLLQESILLEPMFETPGSDITSVHINKDTALGEAPPIYKRVTVAVDNPVEKDDTVLVKEDSRSSHEPSAAEL